MSALRWLLPSLVPVVVAYVVWRIDARREPWKPVVGTYLLGLLFAIPAYYIQVKAAAWTGLDVRTSVAGDAGALTFQFLLVSPMRETAKVAAAWPAFRSRHFDEPFDGIVYAAIAALGFASFDIGWHLERHPASGGGMWLTRVFLGIPAHVFFACMWGYALGRARQAKKPGPLFPATLVAAMAGHGLYTHLAYGRGTGALVGLVPMLLLMTVIALIAARDLRARGDQSSRFPTSSDAQGGRLSRASMSPVSSAPSLRAMRMALQRGDAPVRVRWIVVGTLVTIGAMILGLSASIAFGHYAHVDFAAVDEHDVATTAPVALLGAGLLAAFPLSGALVARASGVPTLLEPALAAGLAIIAALVLLGLAAPIAMVFALAFSPVALALACAGAWVGRVVR